MRTSPAGMGGKDGKTAEPAKTNPLAGTGRSLAGGSGP